VAVVAVAATTQARRAGEKDVSGIEDTAAADAAADATSATSA